MKISEVQTVIVGDYVTIPLEDWKKLSIEFASLEDDSFKLQCLESGGVDNWTWYHDSLKEGGYFDDEED